MLQTIGYEFYHGRWRPRWRLESPVWIDLVYPQYNKLIAGRFLESSYVFEPYAPVTQKI